MTTDDGETFTSWKEIAAYLGKGVRTVQRWEWQFGLPVQRPTARSKGIVRASRKELDEWMKSEWSRPAMKAREAGPVNLRDSPTMKRIANTHDLRASHQELLKQFQESLRMLKTNCEELRGIVRQKDKDQAGTTAA